MIVTNCLSHQYLLVLKSVHTFNAFNASNASNAQLVEAVANVHGTKKRSSRFGGCDQEYQESPAVMILVWDNGYG